MSGMSSEVDVRIAEGAGARAPTTAATVILAAGITERGPFGARLTTSFDAWKKLYGGYTLNNRAMIGAVEAAYANGAQFVRTSRVTHCTVPGDPDTTTSAAGVLDLDSETTALSAGYVETATQPFNLEPGWSLTLALDVGGDQTVGPVAAVAASAESAAEPFVLTDGMTLSVNGVERVVDTSEFVDIGAATAEEVKAILDPFLLANSLPLGALLTAGNTKVKVQTTKRGTDSSFTLAGTMLAALAGTFTAGTKTGTGNVHDVDAVTAVEVAAMLSPTNGTVSAAGGRVRWASANQGPTSTAQVKNTSSPGMVAALGLDNAVHPGGSGAAQATWRLTGKTHGAYVNDVGVAVAAASNGDALSRNLNLVRGGAVVERWFNLSADPASERYFVDVLNDADTGSDLVSAEDLVGDPDPYVVGLPPAVGTHAPFTGGSDGLVGLTDADFVGAKASSTEGTGLYAFALGEEVGDVVIVPGRGTAAAHAGMIAFCEVERKGRCFAVLDPPQDQTAEQMVTYVTQTAALYLSTRLAAIYYPEVRVANPSSAVYGQATTIDVPPSGVVVGVYARTDASKVGGAFDHPAGPDKRYLPRGVLGFATATGEAPSKADRDLMFPYNINFVSREQGLPVFIDGARTLDVDGKFGSVGESRGVIFVRKRLGAGLAVYRHRPINQSLLDGERDLCVQFLVELTRAGAFASTDPASAFFVDFGALGRGINPPSEQRARRTNGRIGLATAKPNEFIVVEIDEDARALAAQLAAALQP